MKVAEILLKFAKLAGVDDGCGVVYTQGELGLLLFELAFEDLAGSRDGVALVVEKSLYAEGHLDVAAAIEALTGAAFVGLELGKLALPEAEHIGGNLAEPSYLADAKVELVRNVCPGGGGMFADWLVLRHARNSESRLSGGGGLSSCSCSV
jgi:hypothetical protein